MLKKRLSAVSVLWCAAGVASAAAGEAVAPSDGVREAEEPRQAVVGDLSPSP